MAARTTRTGVQLALVKEPAALCPRDPSLSVAAIVLIVAAAAVIMLVSQVDARKVGTEYATDEGIVRVLGDGAGAASVQARIALREGADPAREARRMFDALEDVPGLATAEFASASRVLTVRYDKHRVAEGRIVAELQASGYASPWTSARE